MWQIFPRYKFRNMHTLIEMKGDELNLWPSYKVNLLMNFKHEVNNWKYIFFSNTLVKHIEFVSWHNTQIDRVSRCLKAVQGEVSVSELSICVYGVGNFWILPRFGCYSRYLGMEMPSDAGNKVQANSPKVARSWTGRI